MLVNVDRHGRIVFSSARIDRVIGEVIFTVEVFAGAIAE
jgi:hypothetical protein